MRQRIQVEKGFLPPLASLDSCCPQSGGEETEGPGKFSLGWSCPPDPSSVLLRLTADSSHWMSSLETRYDPIPGPLISCHGEGNSPSPSDDGNTSTSCLLRTLHASMQPSWTGSRLTLGQLPVVDSRAALYS